MRGWPPSPSFWCTHPQAFDTKRLSVLAAVPLEDTLSLFDALPDLFSGEGILAEEPETMEEYGQR